MTEIVEISDRVPSGHLDCGSASSRFSSPGVPKSGSPAAALESSYTAACLGVELCDSPRESRHESPRKPRQKPARESNRERPWERPTTSARQRFPQSPCNSTSKSPWNWVRQLQPETRRISRPDSRPKSRPEPRSEPPREPFPERFPPWLPECRFERARPRLMHYSTISYLVFVSLSSANPCRRPVEPGFSPGKRPPYASETAQRGSLPGGCFRLTRYDDLPNGLGLSLRLGLSHEVHPRRQRPHVIRARLQVH
jgi:hypothetical protein